MIGCNSYVRINEEIIKNTKIMEPIIGRAKRDSH